MQTVEQKFGDGRVSKDAHEKLTRELLNFRNLLERIGRYVKNIDFFVDRFWDLTIDRGRPIMTDFDVIAAPSNEALKILEESYFKKNYNMTDTTENPRNAWRKISRAHLLKKGPNNTLIGVGNVSFKYKNNQESSEIEQVDGIDVISRDYFDDHTYNKRFTILSIDGLLVPKNLLKEDEEEIFR